MNPIEIKNLERRFGKTEAVNGLNLTVSPGRCYGLFGRNGAGKTTTIKCLLNLLKPNKGTVRVFGFDPAKNEVDVKSRIGYVPEQVAFYPWMSVRQTLDYCASFRKKWNRALEADLLKKFELDPGKKVDELSRGMKAQLGLLCAICPEPDLLLLDEPTSGLDPIIRREFIQTVIGAFQEGDPANRTIFVSTHLISEFEGLIDVFTIIEKGKDILTLEADVARERFKKIRLRFSGEPPEIPEKDFLKISKEEHELEILTSSFSPEISNSLEALSPESLKVENLTLEEIFIHTANIKKGDGE
jgi:ABC-2 type transport system ATP-binding protein